MSKHPMHGLHWSARFSAWQRQGLALLPALLVGGSAVALGGSGATPWLSGWVVYCGVYITLVWRLARHLDAAGTHRRARWEDTVAAMLVVLVTGLTLMSLLDMLSELLPAVGAFGAADLAGQLVGAGLHEPPPAPRAQRGSRPAWSSCLRH
jgi:hypothetical protein